MTTRKKVRGTAVSMPVGIALGTSTSVLITCIFAALLSWLTLEGRISERTLGYLIMGVLLGSSMIGTILSAAKIKRRWMLTCSITGIAYFLTLLGSTALLFGGNYQGIGVTGLLIFAGSMVSVVMGLIKNRTRDKGYKKYLTC